VFFVHEDDVQARGRLIVGPSERGVSCRYAGVFHRSGEDVVGFFSGLKVEVSSEDKGLLARRSDLDNVLHLGEPVGFVLVAEVRCGEGDFLSAPKRVINCEQGAGLAAFRRGENARNGRCEIGLERLAAKNGFAVVAAVLLHRFAKHAVQAGQLGEFGAEVLGRAAAEAYALVAARATALVAVESRASLGEAVDFLERDEVRFAVGNDFSDFAEVGRAGPVEGFAVVDVVSEDF